MLLHKPQGEVGLALERQWNEQQQQEDIRLAATQPTKAEQCRKKLFQPRAETAQIQMELDLRKQLEAESQRNLQPRMNLRDANRTPADKKAQAEEPRRGQILFSRILPENHHDWRAMATAEFRNKKIVGRFHAASLRCSLG